MTNLYGEPLVAKTETVVTHVALQPDLTPQELVEIDMDDPNLTLCKIIKSTRSVVDQLSNDIPVGIYLVSTMDVGHQFWDDYFKWVETLPNPTVLLFRGNLQLHYCRFFLIGKNVQLLPGVKLIYNSFKLDKYLEMFSCDRELFNNFCQKYFDEYKNIRNIIMDIDELYKLKLI